jgi:hypothetical protein
MKKIEIINQTTNKSFTFYDNGDKTILRDFEGFEYSDVKHAIEHVSGQPGAVYVTSSFGARRLTISGDVVGEDIYETRRDILEVLRQDGRLKLIKMETYDGLELQCEVEVIRVTSPYTHTIHSYLIEFIAPDWRIYSQELKNIEVEVLPDAS